VPSFLYGCSNFGLAAHSRRPPLVFLAPPRRAHRLGVDDLVRRPLLHPHGLGTILDEEDVAIRAGHHCAQPLMDRLGVPATARASFGLYSDEDDVAALLRGIERTKRIFG